MRPMKVVRKIIDPKHVQKRNIVSSRAIREPKIIESVEAEVLHATEKYAADHHLDLVEPIRVEWICQVTTVGFEMPDELLCADPEDQEKIRSRWLTAIQERWERRREQRDMFVVDIVVPDENLERASKR